MANFVLFVHVQTYLLWSYSNLFSKDHTPGHRKFSFEDLETFSGLHITSKSLANASKIFHWRVTHAYYLPAGEYIKNSRYFSKTLNFYNLSVKHDSKVRFSNNFVTGLLQINPMLSKSTWFDKCNWHLTWVAAIVRKSSWSYRYPVFVFKKAIHKTTKTKKTKSKIMKKVKVEYFRKLWVSSVLGSGVQMASIQQQLECNVL